MRCQNTNLLLGNNAQFVRRPFGDFVSAACAAHVQAVELTLQTPHFYVDSTKFHAVEQQKQLLSEADIAVASVHPLPYRYSICAGLDSIQHKKTVEYYQQCILLAKELKASYVCITAAGANYDRESECLLQNAEVTLAKLAVFAEKQGIKLLLGSVFGEESPVNASTPVLTKLEEIQKMIERIGSKLLGAYLDTAVISACGETIPQWFDRLGEHIRLVRFSDGNYNGYRAWNDGCLPCAQYLKRLTAAHYKGPLALTFPGERYVLDPKKAFSQNIDVIRSHMEDNAWQR